MELGKTHPSLVMESHMGVSGREGVDHNNRQKKEKRGGKWFLSFKSVTSLASRLIFLPDVDCFVLSFVSGSAEPLMY